MEANKRLASLDILRGFDLWLLLMFGPVAHALMHADSSPVWNFLRVGTEHAQWIGFTVWDIIMPLFIFMSGVTIPFSNAKYKTGLKPGKAFYFRLLKRFALLFFLGWIVQGNLLKLDFKQFHPYANTLQTIAVGYVVSAIVYVLFNTKKQVAVCAAFFAAYLLAFVFSGMNLDPQQNIAMLIDKAVLGSHRDGVLWAADGSWSYNTYYKYTWILSSLNFVVTAMLGCFAGEILKYKGDKAKAALNLAVFGAILVVAGLAMSPFFPIIKKIWSSSMTLFSGGICALLLAGTFFLVDVKGYQRGIGWLKYFGMNSIAAYCIGEIVVFDSVANSLLFGLEKWLGIYYPVLIAFAGTMILFFVLRLMYKNKIFLKV